MREARASLSLSSCTRTVRWVGFWHVDAAQITGQTGWSWQGWGLRGGSQPGRGAGSGPPPGPEGQAHWTDPVGAPALPSCLSNFPAISWGPGGSRGLRCPVLPILGAPDPLGSPGEGPFGTAPGSAWRLARG